MAEQDPDNAHEQLIDSALRYLDGQLDPAELRNLNVMLSADPLARDRFVALVTQLGLIVESRSSIRIAPLTTANDAGQIPGEYEATGVDRPVALGPLPFFSLHRRTMRYSLAAALVLCVGLTVAALVSMGIAYQTGQPRSTVAIATLTETHDAVFDVSDVSTDAGSQIPGGFLRLKSGTAKVEFFSGAEVTLHGPCEFGLNSDMRGQLKVGKITAYVPERAHGFTVGGPACAVIDLGTRFTMTVGPAGQAAVAVTEGKVRLEQEGMTARELVVHQSARFAPGLPVEIATELPPAPMPPTGDTLIKWNGAKAPLRNDTDYVVGIRFRVGDKPVTLNALGVFDADQDGLAADHPVSIYSDEDGLALRSALVPAGKSATLVGGFRYVPIDPVTLEPGHVYTLATSVAGDPFVDTRDADTAVKPAPEVTLLANVFTQGAWLVRPTTDGYLTPGRWAGPGAAYLNLNLNPTADADRVK